ncbi:restriction endonuclease subunit S [Methylomonas sp. SURF-2]|uniref:Restriction endonuclease subunit S n=1 Tax=Methylomonas subterranea TaxID=2952225 RepID=A0ABT1TJP6_9GAMM|nr:restriction endonuclease subunit S [Methylomonas sp. SURF-2]MCQ8105468.1 restriction endonuclease subunit S [Methylomonas sp. SURF-2]
MHDLLTRGIDANGELRPPQSEAPHLYKRSRLGWIPKEWNTERLGDISALITSGSRGWASYYADSGSLFVRSQNVRMGHLDLGDRQYVLPPSGEEGQRTKLEALDLLVTITGNGVGNVAIVPDDWRVTSFVSQHVGLVRLYDPEITKVVVNFLVEGAPGNRQIVDAQYGQSKPGLNLDSLRNIRIPIPSKRERIEIVESITRSNDRIISEDNDLNQLKMLKIGLMNDLLTGRVRVTPLLGLS